jgi:hypothetical protein
MLQRWLKQDQSSGCCIQQPAQKQQQHLRTMTRWGKPALGSLQLARTPGE